MRMALIVFLKIGKCLYIRPKMLNYVLVMSVRLAQSYLNLLLSYPIKPVYISFYEHVVHVCIVCMQLLQFKSVFVCRMLFLFEHHVRVMTECISSCTAAVSIQKLLTHECQYFVLRLMLCVFIFIPTFG